MIEREKVYGLYDQGWGDLIVRDAYAHPAKYSRKLIYWIVRTGIARGWWTPGRDTLIDPFAGIGSGGIAAAANGLAWLGVELEPKFVELAQRNFKKHDAEWRGLGLPLPRIVQGDSRKLGRIVAEHMGRRWASDTSPPFVDSLLSKDIKFREAMDNPGRNFAEDGYGSSEGQTGKLPLGAISSPPYANRVDDSGTGPVAEKNGTYGESDGQIGNLRMAAKSTPPYADAQGHPSLGSVNKDDWGSDGRDITARRGKTGGYGDSPGQIGALTSPPFGNMDPRASGSGVDLEAQWQTYRNQGGGMSLEAFIAQQQRHQEGYGTTAGQIGNLAGITSPPFTEAQSGGGILKNGYQGRPDLAPDFLAKRHYSEDTAALSPENIASLPIGDVTGAVTSPPYEGTELAGGSTRDGQGYTQGQRALHDYGMSTGQIGQEQRETYWGAISLILEQLYEILPPGGHVAWIVKAFVKNKALVDLPAMTLELMQRQGWQGVTWIDAMLVAEAAQESMLADVPTYRREKKSFFRRLAEKKGSPRIDSEVVLVVRKPL